MTRSLTLTLAALVTLACGDDGNPGSGDTTSTTATTPADATTTDEVPTSGDPGDTSGGMTAATTDTPTTTPAECEHDDECLGGDNPCATGRCNGGACEFVPERAGTPQPDDPGNCVRAECDGAGAVQVVPEDDPPNDNPDDCQAPTCQDGAVKMIPADDPPADMAGDCKRTSCEAGEVAFVPDDLDLPDDTIECTLDACNAGTPAFVPKPPNSFCGEGGAMFCHDDASCRVCKQVTDACEDETNTEANETQQTAFDLGDITDNDNTGGTICPVLKGAADVDWYHFFGDDVFPYTVDPTRVVTTELLVNARLCVYFDCSGNNSTSVNCNADEVDDVAPGGQPGCCGVGNVSPSLNCSGLDDAADVWIKVENVDMAACVPYQFDYHF